MPEFTTISTGLVNLDRRLLDGLRPGHLVVIAGFPSHGISTTALGIARHAALPGNHSVLAVTLESTVQDATNRLLCAHAKVPIHHAMVGRMTDEEWERLQAAAKEVADHDLTVTQDVRDLETLEAVIDQKAPDLLVIDGAHLLIPDHSRDLAQSATDDARRLKYLAMEYGIAVVVTMPLEMSDVYGRIEQRPTLRDFGKRQSYVLDADVVILAWRPDVEEREHARAGEIDLVIAKHRNGPTGLATAAFQAHYARLVGFDQS